MLTEHVHNHITNPEHLRKVHRHELKFSSQATFTFFDNWTSTLQNNVLRRKWNETQQTMDELKLSDFLLSIGVLVAEAVNFRLRRDEFSSL